MTKSGETEEESLPSGQRDRPREPAAVPPTDESTRTTATDDPDKKRVRSWYYKRLHQMKLDHFRASQDAKVVGLKKYGLSRSTRKQRFQLEPSEEVLRHEDLPGAAAINPGPSVEELEEQIRRTEIQNPFSLAFLGFLSALKVFGFYLITLETLATVGASVCLTLFWYYEYRDNSDWNGGSLDFILLAFAIVTPISTAIGMAFMRRERALIAIADFRSFSYHIYLAHCSWDWEEDGGRKEIENVDWIKHCDGVMTQLVGIGDELARFLSLPSASRSRHRMTKSGRKEASQTMEVSYLLLESMTTQRLTRLTLYSEKLKKLGLSVGEVSRIRQYERFLSNSIEQLRMVKLYRTPQALRSFGRIFTVLLPPFYAPNYAQVAMDVHSLGVGVAFATFTALGLTALFESLQILEDPFTAFLTLDGIDVREEFVVLNYAQLSQTRSLFFPDAKPFPPGRRAALAGESFQPGTESVFSFPLSASATRKDTAAGESVERFSQHRSYPSLIDFSFVEELYPGAPSIDDDSDAVTVRGSSYALRQPEASIH